MIETFTASTFSENDVFKIYYGENQFSEFTLSKISEGIHKIPNADKQPFSLLFKGSKEISFGQGIYKMENVKVGSFELFIVPVVAPFGQKDDYFYEAIFS